MPLESSSDNQINIHDLTLEQEKKPVPEWQEQYEKLKDSSFYESETGFWNIAIQDSGKVATRKSTDSQLIGVIVESFLDKEKASAIYQKIKDTNFYNKAVDRWNSSLKSDGEVDGKDNDNENQFFALLCESYLDPNLSKAHFEEFKSPDSVYFDQESGYWMPTRDFRDSDKKTEDYISTDIELLSIIIESSFDIGSARNHWEKMQSSPVYKKNDQTWASGMFEGRASRITGDRTCNQLLGILAEAKFDKKSAKARFEKMQKSDYYDNDLGYWNDRDLAIFPRSRNPIQYHSSDQLLAILCQYEFEEPTPDLQSSTPSLPEIRSY